MAKPPEPPTSELDEVERAISALAGRHPEHERTRRETAVAVEQRRRTLEQELAANAKRRRRRLLIITANVLAVSLAAAVVWRLVARTGRIRESLAHDESPFLAQGFQELAANHLSASRTLEADVPGSSCFVALATDGDVVVQAGAASTLSASRSVGWCGCVPGHVTVQAARSGETSAGLAVLRIDGSVAGGVVDGVDGSFATALPGVGSPQEWLWLTTAVPRLTWPRGANAICCAATGS